MWQQILCLWVITCVSATGVEDKQLSTINLTDIILPRINFLEMVISGFLSNSTENKLQYEEESLQFLQRKVVDDLHFAQLICESPYEVACDWYWIKSNRPTEKDLVLGPLKDQFILLKKEIENLLLKPVLNTDTNSLATEKQLYQDCLKLREKPNISKYYNVIDYAFDDIISNLTHKSWQVIDKDLERMGFDYTFFNIAVTEHYQTKKKMLLLQPPSSIKLVDSFTSLKKVTDVLKLHPNHKREFELAMIFFAALNKANSEYSRFDTMTIPEWYDYYLKANDGRGSQSSEIYWHELLHSAARHHNIDTKYIIVRNKEYFQELERLLRTFSKSGHDIASFVAIKWLINNLYFVDMSAYNQLHAQDKSTTCMQQIKLYGASQVVLQILEENTDIENLLETAKTILRFIVKNIDIDILISQNLKENDKSMLRTYLHDITASILDNETQSSVADNFYEDLKITHNYFKDIINYRKNIYEAESRFIDNYRSPEQLPFNINDLSRSQNRLLLRAYLRMHLIASPHLHKEYHYGVYGTEMSRFIYDLVLSEKLGVKEIHEHDEEWLYTSVQFPNEFKSCLLGKVPDDEIDTVISEVIALKTAYESMRQNYLRDLEIRKPFVFDDHVTYSEDAIFILSYLKNHCFWRGDLGYHVLQNFERATPAFGCNFESPQCNIGLF